MLEYCGYGRPTWNIRVDLRCCFDYQKKGQCPCHVRVQQGFACLLFFTMPWQRNFLSAEEARDTVEQATLRYFLGKVSSCVAVLFASIMVLALLPRECQASNDGAVEKGQAGIVMQRALLL